MWMQRALTFIQVRISGGRQEECGVGGWGGIIAKIITFLLLLRGEILHPWSLLLLQLLLPGSSVSSFGNAFGFGYRISGFGYRIRRFGYRISAFVYRIIVAESDRLVTESDVDLPTCTATRARIRDQAILPRVAKAERAKEQLSDQQASGAQRRFPEPPVVKR